MDDHAILTGTRRINKLLDVIRQGYTETRLPTPLHLIINLKECGYVHRVSKDTVRLARDKRRAHCGWRAGSAVAQARFCSTEVWPPLGSEKARVCSKCFPGRYATGAFTALESDPVESIG